MELPSDIGKLDQMGTAFDYTNKPEVTWLFC
jgi:hypothetical protein